MEGLDGRRRKIQSANTKNALRLIQSIPSPKAEPFKMWLAEVGAQRLDEIADLAKRQFAAAADSSLKYICIQVKENSLQAYTADDAVIC